MVKRKSLINLLLPVEHTWDSGREIPKPRCIQEQKMTLMGCWDVLCNLITLITLKIGTFR